MEYKGFEISLNDKLLCKAGFGNNHGIVTCIIDAILRKDKKEQELFLNISGLNSDTGQHVKWLRNNALNEHDTIVIKVIKNDFDSPNEIREKKSEEFLLEQKIKTYKRLKEELKGYL